MLFSLAFFKILVSQVAEVLDKLCFLGIIRLVIGSIQIVKPLCEVVAHFGIFFILLPDTVPRLVGLIFSCHKSPIVAADVFKIE